MKKIVIKTLGDTIRVIEKDISDRNGDRGYWDAGKGEIVIHSNMSEGEKYATLIHEYMHMIDEIMIQNKVYSRRTPHKNILNIADNLLVLLVMSGLFKGLSPKDAKELLDNMKE